MRHKQKLHKPKPHSSQYGIAVFTAMEKPNYRVDQLPTAPDTGRLMVPVPEDEPLRGKIPEFLVIRLDQMWDKTHRYKLNKAFDAFMATNPSPVTEGKDKLEFRAKGSTFFHFGFWRKSAPHIFLSADSRSKTSGLRPSLRRVLWVLQKHFIPKIVRALRPVIPSHFKVTDQYVYNVTH